MCALCHCFESRASHGKLRVSATCSRGPPILRSRRSYGPRSHAQDDTQRIQCGTLKHVPDVPQALPLCRMRLRRQGQKTRRWRTMLLASLVRHRHALCDLHKDTCSFPNGELRMRWKIWLCSGALEAPCVPPKSWGAADVAGANRSHARASMMVKRPASVKAFLRAETDEYWIAKCS